jgi:hypothetical protein
MRVFFGLAILISTQFSFAQVRSNAQALREVMSWTKGSVEYVGTSNKLMPCRVKVIWHSDKSLQVSVHTPHHSKDEFNNHGVIRISENPDSSLKTRLLPMGPYKGFYGERRFPSMFMVSWVELMADKTSSKLEAVRLINQYDEKGHNKVITALVCGNLIRQK